MLSNLLIAALTGFRFGVIKNKIVNNQYMKKLAIFIFSAILIVVAGVIPKENALDLSGAKKVVFVMDSDLAQEKNLQFVQSGNDAIVSIDCESVRDRYNEYNPKSVIYEFALQDREYVENFLSLGQTQVQNLENMKIEYGYTSKFDKCEFVAGKKVNIMIVEKEELLLVGFPIIMTGF